MSQNLDPTCPQGCVGAPAENTFDYCKQTIVTGEVGLVFLAGGAAQCFTDWTQLGEWATRISETSMDPDAIRRFRGVGDAPGGTSDAVDISLCQKYYPEKTFTLNFDVEDVSQENYDFMRQVECNQLLKGWYAAGGYLFGGNCGVDVSIGVNYVIERGCKTLHKIKFIFSWEHQFSPQRTVNPIA
ncbi:MAG: hypothetical protein V1904_01140 [Bacteroidota bacterium]